MASTSPDAPGVAAVSGGLRPSAPTEAARRWAEALLPQIFEVASLACPSCHGAMRVVAFITHTSVIDQILTHLRTRAAHASHAGVTVGPAGPGSPARTPAERPSRRASETTSTRIIIPSVFRDEHLSGLRNLSRQGYATTLIDVLAYAHQWTATLPWADYAAAEQTLRACHAFERPRPDIRLRMPPALA